MTGMTSFELPADAERIDIYDLHGKIVWSERREGRTAPCASTCPPDGPRACCGPGFTDVFLAPPDRPGRAGPGRRVFPSSGEK